MRVRTFSVVDETVAELAAWALLGVEKPRFDVEFDLDVLVDAGGPARTQVTCGGNGVCLR